MRPSLELARAQAPSALAFALPEVLASIENPRARTGQAGLTSVLKRRGWLVVARRMRAGIERECRRSRTCSSGGTYTRVFRLSHSRRGEQY